MTRRPSRKSRPTAPKPVYQITIKGDTPSRTKVLGYESKKSQPFVNTNRQTRLYTTTTDKDNATRIKKSLEAQGERVVVTKVY